MERSAGRALTSGNDLRAVDLHAAPGSDLIGEGAGCRFAFAGVRAPVACHGDRDNAVKVGARDVDTGKVERKGTGITLMRHKIHIVHGGRCAAVIAGCSVHFGVIGRWPKIVVVHLAVIRGGR